MQNCKNINYANARKMQNVKIQNAIAKCEIAKSNKNTKNKYAQMPTCPHIT